MPLLTSLRIITEPDELISVLRAQEDSNFQVPTQQGAFFNIGLTSDSMCTDEVRHDTEFCVRETKWVKHGTTPLTYDGLAPALYFNRETAMIWFRWNHPLPHSVEPHNLYMADLLF